MNHSPSDVVQRDYLGDPGRRTRRILRVARERETLHDDHRL
jgi:hypothetical protein